MCLELFIFGEKLPHLAGLWRNADGTEMGVSGVFREIQQPKRIVEFPNSQQTSIGGHPGPMKFQLQPPVEIEPQTPQAALLGALGVAALKG